jgi:hypothetical protein
MLLNGPVLIGQAIANGLPMREWTVPTFQVLRVYGLIDFS